VRAAFALALAAVLAACAAPEERPPPPRPASSVFSPDAAAHLESPESSAGTKPFAKDPDPAALGEILAAAPKNAPQVTGPDGGTLVGTNTELVEKDPKNAQVLIPAHKDPGLPKISIKEGDLDVGVGIPSPAVERAARAQLYHSLVTRCRDQNGKLLPPDAIVLHFRIDADGYIVPPSISAIASDPNHADAAACMRRELAGSSFRAPMAARGMASMVNATVPSVD
jgi:hypothetical protein